MYSNKKFFKKFEDGITEIRRIFPAVELYTGKDGEFVSERDVIQNMMTKVFERYPVLEDPEFKSVPSFLIKHSRISIRVGNFYSLDWFVIRPRRQREGTTPVEIGYDFVVTIYNSVETSTEVKFRNEGWEQTELPADQLYTSQFRQRNRRTPAVINEDVRNNDRISPKEYTEKRIAENNYKAFKKQMKEAQKLKEEEEKEPEYPFNNNIANYSRWDKNSKNYRGYKEERTRNKFDDDGDEVKPNKPLVSKVEDDEEENKILAMTEKIGFPDEAAAIEPIESEEEEVTTTEVETEEVATEPEVEEAQEEEPEPISSPMLDRL